MFRVSKRSQAVKKMLGSLSRSIETRRVAKKSVPMFCIGASLSIKQGIYFIRSTISSQLEARDTWGLGEMKATHSTESSSSCAEENEGLLGSG